MNARLDSQLWGASRPSSTGSRHWNPHDVNTLRLAVEAGQSDVEIAATLNRSERSIAIKRARLGLTVRTLDSVRGVKGLSTDTLATELRRRGFVCTAPPERDREFCDAIAALYDLTFDDMLAHRRRAKVAEARQIACYLLHKVLGKNYAHIGRLLNRRSDTIKHSCDIVRGKLARWPGGKTALAVAQAEQAITTG